MPSAPPATRDKDVVQIYGCDSCWTKYSTKTDPCSCSEWEEDQRLQGDFEFGEPQSKTCCNSQIAEINERLDKICAKIEFYERYFGQADNQEEDIQKVCSECCESSPEPPKIIQKCEPTCESVSKIKAKDGKLPATTSLPSAKPQVEETSKSAGANIQSVNKAKAKAEETKQGEDKSRSSVDLSSKEKAERDICRYCCSRSSLKGIPSACVQQCKGKLNPCEEKLKRDPVQAEKCMKSSQNVTQAPKPPIPQCKGNQPVKCLSTTESKCKKSCKFLDENEKTEDPGSKKASGESVCCKCTSKSQTNVVKPIIKTGSGKCEGRCSYQILEQQPSQQEVESQKGTSQSFVQYRTPPSKSSRICIKCCEGSLQKTKTQPQMPDRTCYKCLANAIERSHAALVDNGDIICAKCCKPFSQKKEEEHRVEAQEVCKRCWSESTSQKQMNEKSIDSVKDDSKTAEDETQESPSPQRRKCAKCNKEYVMETARKIHSDLKEGLCDTCCLEIILSRLTLRVEPDGGAGPDTSQISPDNRRSSTGGKEGMKADSTSRLQTEKPETEKGDKRLVDKEEQSDLEIEEPKKKKKSFLRRKKSDKGIENEDKNPNMDK